MNGVRSAVLSAMAVIAMLLFFPAAFSDSRPCVDINGCPAGSDIPTVHSDCLRGIDRSKCPAEPLPCCNPPPCEFERDLKLARAEMKILNVWISLGYPNEQVYQLTTTKLFDDLMDEAMPCPGDPRTDEAPILSAFEADQCKIKHMLDDDQDSAEILLEDLKQEYNACSELLEAEYAKAKTDRQICLVELYRGSSRSLAEKIQQDMERIKSKLDVLESYQQLWEGECSTKPDIKPAQDAFDDDLAELVKAPKQPKSKAKKKPKAKRSTKKSGGK